MVYALVMDFSKLSSKGHFIFKGTGGVSLFCLSVSAFSIHYTYPA